MEGPLTVVEEKVDAGALLIPILRPAQLRRRLAGLLPATREQLKQPVTD